ncbi:MAG: ECF transporter S component [Ruthenibacterium sp.]
MESMNKQKFSTRQIVQIALMAALVFVGTNLRIKIPVGGDGTMLHLGNVFCLLAGMLFGAVPGGLAAGLGSAIFDLTSEYASEAWITFINKFLMGFVAGLVAHWHVRHAPSKTETHLRTIVAGVAGSVTYCVLYILKTIVTQHYINGLVWQAVWPIVAVKGMVTFTNGMIAVAVSLLLVFALRPALRRAHLLEDVPAET